MNQQDEYILEEIRKDNTIPFKTLFQDYYPVLCHFAERYGLSFDVAEDLVQDLFARLWENRKSTVITTSIKSYLFQSTRNLCLNYLKHNEVKKRFRDYSLHVQSDRFYNDTIIEEELNYAIYQAIEDLPPKCREVLKLSRFEGKSHDEISAKMGITKKTINNQLGKAFKLIKKHLIDNEIIIFS
ncbi:MAG: RNA polymerase sigma-70 factor [Mangrovibacterium sp.]|nr:RNA polymerase sigma-70 factor [Mangrovibacterium sp.]